MQQLAPNVAKSLDRVRAVIEEGAPYEAQQMLKSIYHRHKSRKQVLESLQVLKEGAVLQLAHGQVTCGVELGLLLTEAYINDGIQATDESVKALQSIIHALPDQPPSASGGPHDGAAAAAAAGESDADKATIDESTRFVTAAVKWAQRQQSSKAVRSLHDDFAAHLWRRYGRRQLARISLHYARGSDAPAFVAVLVSCSQQAPPSEADLFQCRAVLQLLSAASRRSAPEQLQYARRLLDGLEAAQPLSTPLAHFTTLYVKALEAQALPLARLLKERYAPSLQRDPSFAAYVVKVEQAFFGVAPAGGGMGGLLNGLLQSLGAMGGDFDDDEDGDGGVRDDKRIDDDDDDDARVAEA